MLVQRPWIWPVSVNQACNFVWIVRRVRIWMSDVWLVRFVRIWTPLESCLHSQAWCHTDLCSLLLWLYIIYDKLINLEAVQWKGILSTHSDRYHFRKVKKWSSKSICWKITTHILSYIFTSAPSHLSEGYTIYVSFSCVMKVLSHWLQLHVTPPWFDFLWVVKYYCKITITLITMILYADIAYV